MAVSYTHLDVYKRQHTAGAVRIGFVARNLLGEEVKEAEILLYGSFLATGRGHGTDRALVGGLMGMKPDDYRIPNSIELSLIHIFCSAHLIKVR